MRETIKIIKSKWKNDFPKSEYIEALEKLNFNITYGNTYDYVLFGCPRRDTMQEIGKVLRENPEKCIVVDEADDPFIRKLKNKNVKYFKRELYNYKKYKALLNKQYILSYFWTPMGIPNQRIQNVTDLIKPFQNIDIWGMTDKISIKNEHHLSILHEIGRGKVEKTYDLSIIMSTKDNVFRKYWINRVLKVVNEKKLNVITHIDKNITFSDYIKITQQSKMALSLYGCGHDTYRYWEIPACRTVLLSPPMNKIKITNDFINRKSALFFQTEKELADSIDYGLDNWKRISDNGYNNYQKHHTPTERIKNIMDCSSN